MIKWKNDMSVGIEEIDAHHKRIIVASMIKKGKAIEIIRGKTEKALFDNIHSHILPQSFRDNHRAVLLLIVFEDGDESPSYGKS
jgi:hypothetical protein